MKFGITQAFQCNYLPDEQEQLLVCVEPTDVIRTIYPDLTYSGFRRSGEQVYRPHCESCNACESLRVLVDIFKPTKSQKRVLSKNKDLSIRIAHEHTADYFPLYERYVNQVHTDGAMYPASREQYDGFIHCSWMPPLFLEAYLEEKLVAVAVTDTVSQGYSSLYTFYHPAMTERSLGTFMILQQIAFTQGKNKPYLYLGYQVDDCRKMNYKAKFLPHERFRHNKWHLNIKT